MQLTDAALAAWPRRRRPAPVNSLPGFQSAHLPRTRAAGGPATPAPPRSRCPPGAAPHPPGRSRGARYVRPSGARSAIVLGGPSVGLAGRKVR